MRGDPDDDPGSSDSSPDSDDDGRENAMPVVEAHHKGQSCQSILQILRPRAVSLRMMTMCLRSDDFLAEEPSITVTADSEQTKARKDGKRRCKLNKLKHQQAFLKEDPPFTYILTKAKYELAYLRSSGTESFVIGYDMPN